MSDKLFTAIGLMSGTSLDGEIDVALVRTDGQSHVEALDFRPFPYDKAVRDKVRACFGKRERDAQVDEAEKLVTDLHIRAVKESGFDADIIGFHGQSITHDPGQGFTWQLGDGQRLADETGMDVVYDLRQADIQAGGQGAPLIPIYHQAITVSRERPLAVLNLGGVANVTFIGSNGDLLAFDIGPANALIDDYIYAQTGRPFDENGAIAMSSAPDQDFVNGILSHNYFQAKGPKSLDRNDFQSCLNDLPKDDLGQAVASLTALTVQSIWKSVGLLPEKPKEWLVCGGGRKNMAMMAGLRVLLQVPVNPIEAMQWNGDAIEAQGFAYLAVRSFLGLPLTYTNTTGVKAPMTGGVLKRAGLAKKQNMAPDQK